MKKPALASLRNKQAIWTSCPNSLLCYPALVIDLRWRGLPSLTTSIGPITWVGFRV